MVSHFNRKAHWEKVYTEKTPEGVSWYQRQPAMSLELIVSSGIGPTGKIIDVGGGASVLVDKLLDKGFKDLTVLDISAGAMDYAKERLGTRAENVHWIEADVTEFEPSDQYDLWHDRAVFHFLTDTGDRKKYVKCVRRALRPGGHLIISTFAMEGPPQCSGLDIERYSPDKLKNELGGSFELIRHVHEVHQTPWNKEQKFMYCCFKV